MKANEAPKKLYLHSTAKGEVGASWLTFPLTDKDIEYSRTDAFIEKAVSWMKENADMYEAFDSESKSYYMDKDKLVEDFRKYIEGE